MWWHQRCHCMLGAGHAVIWKRCCERECRKWACGQGAAAGQHDLRGRRTHIHVRKVDLQRQDAHMLRPLCALHQADCLSGGRARAASTRCWNKLSRRHTVRLLGLLGVITLHQCHLSGDWHDSKTLL